MTERRKIWVIAHEIWQDWDKMQSSSTVTGFGDHPAKPYWRAMNHLRTLNDNYGADSARSVVLYFLSNAGSWRGPVARRIKAELKEMLDAK